MVGVNPEKNPLFTPDERIEMIRHEIDTITQPKLKKNKQTCDIKVEKYSGLTAQFMKANKAPYYIRGLRLGTEFDSEYPALVAGKNEYKEFTPLFFCTADPLLQVVSSSLAREIESFGGKTTGKYVSSYIENKLKKRIKEKKSSL
jgi:pantetheine-phosphate adenylyltransferase